MARGVARLVVEPDGSVTRLGQQLACEGFAPGSECIVVGHGTHFEIYEPAEWDALRDDWLAEDGDDEAGPCAPDVEV